MNNPPKSDDSMENILASIREIIAEDAANQKGADGPQEGAGDRNGPAQGAATDPADKDDDVLELTQMVEQDGRIVSLSDTGEDKAASEKTEAPKAASEAPERKEDGLVSGAAASASTTALGRLAGAVAEQRAAREDSRRAGASALDRTLEDIAREAMEPVLRDWLDQNLPEIVERAVEKEVRRLARRLED